MHLDYCYRRHLVEYRRLEYFAGPLFLIFPRDLGMVVSIPWHLVKPQYSGREITSGSIEILAMEVICPTKLKPAVIAW